MSIVQGSDFIGEYFVSKKLYSFLDDYILEYEKKYLFELLGAELYKLFIADLSGTPQVPQNAPYTTIFNDITEDLNGNLILTYGIKKMLVQFIYFHYVRDLQIKNTTNGSVTNDSELGAFQNPNYNVTNIYNKGVDNAQNIQYFILENLVDFETFNGIEFLPTTVI